MSLIDSENYDSLYSFSTSYSLVGLFSYCSGLTDASELNLQATSVTNYCYYLLFKECHNLLYAPQLPATVLGTYCYQDTFSTC